MKIPPSSLRLGMMMMAKGLALVISGEADYFNDACISPNGNGPVDRARHSGLEVPNAVFILFGAAIIANLILTKTVLGAILRPWQQREATRLSGVNGCLKTAVYALGGARRAGRRANACLNSAQPMLGVHELDAIAVVIGVAQRRRSTILAR